MRELSKVTDSLGQRIEELESHTVKMTRLKRSVTIKQQRSQLPGHRAVYIGEDINPSAPQRGGVDICR